MTQSQKLIAVALVALVVGVFTGSTFFDSRAEAFPNAQIRPDGERFHVSAYGGDAHGCYFFDAGTGQVWHSNVGNEPVEIGNILVPKERPVR